MPKEAITTEVRGHVLCMAINRPGKRNAFSVEMYRELGRAYGRLESEKNCAAVYYMPRATPSPPASTLPNGQHPLARAPFRSCRRVPSIPWGSIRRNF